MRGISKVVVAVAGIVLIAVAGIGVFLSTRGPSIVGTTSTGSTSSAGSTASTNTQGAPPPGARAAFNQHLLNMDSRNIPVVLNDYTDNPVVVWTGNTAGLGGVYTGAGNIRLLLASALSTAQQITLAPTNYIVKNDSASRVTVNATLAMSGNSQILGPFNGTIIAQSVFTLTNGVWKISNEAWYYKTFNVTTPGGSTTFPEWQKIGPINPTRKSSDQLHNFAWDFGGPGVAATIYLSIGVLVTLLVLKRPRNP